MAYHSLPPHALPYPPYAPRQGYFPDVVPQRQDTGVSTLTMSSMGSSSMMRTGSDESGHTTTTAGGSSTSSSCSASSLQRKRVRLSSEERLQRSRERNRVHARKTRKRKKVQMESIQNTIENLQEEGRRMRLAVTEWYTANILLVMCQPGPGASKDENGAAASKDDGLLSKYMNVQAFLERTNENAAANTKAQEDLQSRNSDNGFGADDTSSLGDLDETEEGKVAQRGRCKYAPEDRERIRRERNRIHAKRTRDRRKKFMEESEKVMGKLIRENEELRQMLDLIYGDRHPATAAHAAAVAHHATRGDTSVASSSTSTSSASSGSKRKRPASHRGGAAGAAGAGAAGGPTTKKSGGSDVSEEEDIDEDELDEEELDEEELDEDEEEDGEQSNEGFGKKQISPRWSDVPPSQVGDHWQASRPHLAGVGKMPSYFGGPALGVMAGPPPPLPLAPSPPARTDAPELRPRPRPRPWPRHGGGHGAHCGSPRAPLGHLASAAGRRGLGFLRL